MSSVDLMETADGSHTLKHAVLDETYHSSHGALTESAHVFIREGLRHFWQEAPQATRILEIGLGTGLNALLAWQEARREGVLIDYLTLEPFPVPEAVWRQLNYGGMVGEEGAAMLERLHEAPWGEAVPLDAHFRICKLEERLEACAFEQASFQVVFFDAFAPKTQPELWTPDALGKCYGALAPGGVLTTYCAQGQFKRDLRALGFAVAKVQGPPNGKREMTRAVKPLGA